MAVGDRVVELVVGCSCGYKIDIDIRYLVDRLIKCGKELE